MPNTDPAVDNPVTVEYLVARGKRAGGARVLPSGCVSKGRQGKQLAELGLMAASGAVMFTDDGSPVSEREAAEDGAAATAKISTCESWSTQRSPR